MTSTVKTLLYNTDKILYTERNNVSTILNFNVEYKRITDLKTYYNI
mgnify:CR=1 FL=1